MPKKTVKEIVESGNHYLIQVKENQPSLLKDIVKTSEKMACIAQANTTEHDRGSTKTWKTEVFGGRTTSLKEQWMGLQTYIVITKTEISKGKQTISKRYFMTDLGGESAAKLGANIRKHWGIENKLHRTTDVLFNQDNNKIKQPTRAVNMAIFNTLAINVLLQLDQAIDFAIMRMRAEFKEVLKKYRT